MFLFNLGCWIIIILANHIHLSSNFAFNNYLLNLRDRANFDRTKLYLLLGITLTSLRRLLDLRRKYFQPLFDDRTHAKSISSLRRRSLHLDVRASLRLQGLRESTWPRAQVPVRLVLVGESREDGTHQPDAERLGLQSVVADRPQEGQTAGQCRVWHQRHQRVLHVRPEQRLQRRHRLARRRMLPWKAVRLRGLRGVAQLRGQHQPRYSPLKRSWFADTYMVITRSSISVISALTFLLYFPPRGRRDTCQIRTRDFHVAILLLLGWSQNPLQMLDKKKTLWFFFVTKIK